MAWLPRGWVGLGWTLLNAALLLWVTRVSYRAFLDGQGAAWPVALACMAGIMAFSAPVLSVFDLGQVGILLLAMVLADTVPERTRLPRGVLVGAATAIKLTPGVVRRVLDRDETLACRGRRDRHHGGHLGADRPAAARSVPYLLVGHRDPPDTRRRPGRRDRPIDERPAAAARMDRRRALGGRSPRSRSASGLVRASAAHRAGNELAAITLIGIATVLASPVSWIHHAVWIVPATGVILGDGRDRGRRIAWTATTVLFLLHVPVWSTLLGLSSDGLGSIVLGNAYVWAAWGLLLFLPTRAPADEALEVGRPGRFGTLTPFHGSRLRIPLVAGDVCGRRVHRGHLRVDAVDPEPDSRTPIIPT